MFRPPVCSSLQQLSPTASIQDTQKWLLKNRFSSYTRLFSNFSGMHRQVVRHTAWSWCWKTCACIRSDWMSSLFIYLFVLRFWFVKANPGRSSPDLWASRWDQALQCTQIQVGHTWVAASGKYKAKKQVKERQRHNMMVPTTKTQRVISHHASSRLCDTQPTLFSVYAGQCVPGWQYMSVRSPFKRAPCWIDTALTKMENTVSPLVYTVKTNRCCWY